MMSTLHPQPWWVLSYATVLPVCSMEESEALCTRLVIMVNGEFCCLGGLQHLKSKFGSGYTLHVKVTANDEASGDKNVESVKTFIEKNLSGSVLQEAHQGLLEYQVPSGAASWSQIFRLLDELQNTALIDDYSISQTSLDQVFLSFARNQEAPVKPPKSMIDRLLCRS